MHGIDRPQDADAWMRRQEQRLTDLEDRLRNAGVIRTAANVVTTTDSNGRASFLFGRTFPAVPVVTLTGGNGEHVAIHANTITTSGFTVQFRFPTTGDPIVSASVRLLWTATPATT